MRQVVLGVSGGLALGGALFAACSDSGDMMYRGHWDAGVDAGIDAPPDMAAEAVESAADSAPEVSLSDAGVPPDFAWLADPNVWTPAPGNEHLPNCPVFEGQPSKLQFKPFTWESCGPGCSKAEVLQQFSFAALPALSTAQMASGPVAHLAIQQAVEGTNVWFKALRLVDLSSGLTPAAVLQQESKVGNACPLGTFEADAFASIVGASGYQAPFTWDPSLPGWRWGLPALPIAQVPQGRVGFTVESPVPVRITTGKGAVNALLDPDKHQWTLLEASSKSQVGAGQGDLAVWTDYPAPGSERIRGWSADGKGIRTLIDPVPFETCRVAVSPTRIVGTVTDNCKLTWASVRLWRAARTYLQSAAAPELSPVLAYGSAGELRSWGNFAAFLFVEPSDAAVYDIALVVVDLSTWKAWRVDPTPGHVFGKAWSLTDEALFAGESSKTQSSMHVAAIKRIELAKLSEAATAIN